MKKMLDFMKSDNMSLPNDLPNLIQLYQLAEFYTMEPMMAQIVSKIIEVPFFRQFTNVRRYITMYIEQSSLEMVKIILENLPSDILVFTLTDPTLADLFPDLSVFKPLFVKQYK